MEADDRQRILEAVRAALQPLRESGTAAPLPDYDPAEAAAHSRLAGDGSWETFRRNFEAVRGRFFDSPAALRDWLAERQARCGYCDPALAGPFRAAFGPEFELHTVFDRDRADTYAFGITRASGAIAETGSLILTDAETSSRLGSVAPWIHVAVLRRDPPFRTLGDALESLPDDPNIIFVTGPSKTADVESIIVEGVHGPGEQVACFLDEVSRVNL